MRGYRGLALPALLVAVPYLAVRLPFLMGHAVPGLQGDTSGYFGLIEQALSGTSPTFAVRTPGYPLFLSAAMILTRDAVGIVALQLLLSLASQWWLVSGVHALRPSLALGAALSIAVTEASFTVFDMDTSFMADSVYGSCLLVAAGCILRLFRERGRVRDHLLVPLSMAAAILTRPAGLFLLGTWVLLLWLLLRRGTPRNAALAFVVPLPAALLGLCAYNLATIGDFSISPWGTINILGATACYWQRSDAYPPDVAKAIANAEAGLTAAERQTLDESLDLSVLGGIYVAHYDDVHKMGPLAEFGSREGREVLRRVARDAIAARPDLYAKFVASQFQVFLGQVTGSHWGNYEDLIARRTFFLLNPNERRWYLRKHLDLRFPNVRGLPDIHIPTPSGQYTRVKNIEVDPPAVVRFLTRFGGVFRGSAWVWAWLLVLLTSAWKVVRSRGRDPGAGVILAVGTLHLGAGVLVSLVNIGAARFSAPTEFSVYLSLALAPLLLPLRGDGKAMRRPDAASGIAPRDSQPDSGTADGR